MNQNRRMQCNRQGAFAQKFSYTGGATSSLPVWRRIGQRGRYPSQCGGESGSGDAAPHGVKANRGQRGLCPSRISRVLQVPPICEDLCGFVNTPNHHEQSFRGALQKRKKAFY